MNNQTQQAFDGLNRLITTTNADLSTSSYDWDDRNVLTDVTDERSLVTTYVRNGWGEVIREDSPDSGITDYERDSAGNITKRTDARNVVTNYSYDALNRMTDQDYPATPADDVTYTYDETTGGNEGVGRLTKIEDGSGSIAFTYDHRGNVTQEVRVIGTTSYTTSYAYDLADRVTEITYPSGCIVSYGRDTHGRVTSVTTKPDSLGTAVTVAGSITYDPFGPVTGLEHGNGLDLTRTFDDDGRITDILTTDGTTDVQDLDYGYDDANGITSITDNLVAARSETFAYNNRRRLSDADGLYGDIDYVYDAVGNRTSRVTDDGVITVTDTYTLASTSNRLSSTTDGSTTRSFTYSATGAVTEDDRGSGTPYDLIYNDEDRLVEIKQGSTTLATYEHNALGERVDKTAGSDTTHYHYAQDGKLIAESEDDGTVQREVIYLGDLPIAQVDSTGVSAELYRIHADHLGTPRVMTDGSKAVVWDAVFKPFGEVQSLTGTATNDNRFQGRRYDDVAGYHYNYFRDYDPRLGRYLQSDPIGLAGGLSTFGYANGNPIVNADPYGLAVTVVCRPLAVPILRRYAKHCAVFVWHKDSCGNVVIDRQYTIAMPDQEPMDQNTKDDPVFDLDREAFENPSEENEHYPIEPPDGMTSDEFDAKVTEKGDDFSQDPYRAWPGPNSNTATDDIVESAGGTVPDIPRAVGQNYGE